MKKPRKSTCPARTKANGKKNVPYVPKHDKKK